VVILTFRRLYSRYSLNRRLGRPQSRSGRDGEDDNLSTAGYPTHRQSFCLLLYSDLYTAKAKVYLSKVSHVSREFVLLEDIYPDHVFFRVIGTFAFHVLCS
jgi:hypothetical protein